MMKFENVIITVPHSKGLMTNYRTYDLAAPNFAEILYKKLEENKTILDLQNIKLIKSSNNRLTQLDDNRFMNYNTQLSIKNDSKLWNELRETVLEYIKQCKFNILILDIHSFPDNTPSFGKNDVVLLDNVEYQSITIDLYNFIRNKNNNLVKVLPSLTGGNSILDVFTLHPIYIPTLLVEINEKYKDDYDKLSLIADDFIDFLKKENKKNNNLKIKKYKFSHPSFDYLI